MGNVRYPIDYVIRCFGWAMDLSIFDASVRINTSHKGKYPQITPGYEVIGVPGLYVAGTLSHSLDFRRSAGGFIHGFRYTARALFRLLEEKNFATPWPHALFPLQLTAEKGGQCEGFDALLERILSRMNDASGPYQMFETLGDMVLFETDPITGTWVARYLEEVPLSLFEERYRHLARLTWVFRYAHDFYGPKVLGSSRVGSTTARTAHRSNFLHPHLAYFPAGAENAAKQHWLTEDIFTQWESSELHLPLLRFLEQVAAAATGAQPSRKVGRKEENRTQLEAAPAQPSVADSPVIGAVPETDVGLPSDPGDVEKEMAMLKEVPIPHLKTLELAKSEL